MPENNGGEVRAAQKVEFPPVDVAKPLRFYMF